jgi:hypothetical protein
MVWQDIIISIVIVAFGYALIPQIIDGFKNRKSHINLQTSLITSTGMYILTFIYFTLGLYFSTAIAFITGTLWVTLFLQKIIYK